MRRLGLDELAAQSEDFDLAVEATRDIDHFCSSSDWILPAALALMPPRDAWIAREDASYWAFMRAQHPDGFYYLEPLEAMWALACPLLGADNQHLVEGVERLCQLPLRTWAIMAVPGLDAEHALFRDLVTALASSQKLGLGVPTCRLIIDLEDGVEGFLGRRTSNFRRGLRRSQSRARTAGIVIEDASAEDPQALFARIIAVEERGWKGREGAGITHGGMHDFYQLMLPRLSKHARARVMFARHDDKDIAYILGGIRCGGYRGLQFSYDADYRHYGLGNLLQVEQIASLCEEGVWTYDLGMHMEYKIRWADRQRETVTLLIMRD